MFFVIFVHLYVDLIKDELFLLENNDIFVRAK